MKGNAGFSRKRSASGEDHGARGGGLPTLTIAATVMLDKKRLCALKAYTPMRHRLGLVGVNWVPESKPFAFTDFQVVACFSIDILPDFCFALRTMRWNFNPHDFLQKTN